MELTAACRESSNDLEASRSFSQATKAMESSEQRDSARQPCVSRVVWGTTLVTFGCLVLFLMVQRNTNNGAMEPRKGDFVRRLQTVHLFDMKDAPVFTDANCNGIPSSGWGGLGKNLQPEDCRQRCLADASCKFVVHRQSNGACSSFASCDKTKVASGFKVFSKQITFLDFGPLLAGITQSCISTPEKPSFKVLGCRGTDSRCTSYSAPSAVNEQPCKALRRAGADCTWAKEDPTGVCRGHDSRCGQDSYKTEWRCTQLRKLGASCHWRRDQKFSKPAHDSKDMKKEVDDLSKQLNMYVPALHLDPVLLMPLFSGSVPAAMCKDRADTIRQRIIAYADATAMMQLALNPNTKVADLSGLIDEATAGASGLSSAFADFRKGGYAPVDFGCTGHHSACAGQTTPKTCKKAGGDCAWATIQEQSGRCTGNDSRCSKEPMKHWKEGCDTLKAQHASCSWVVSESYDMASKSLAEKLKGIVAISSSDLQRVLSTDFDKRLTALEGAAIVVEMSLSRLKLAVGMSRAKGNPSKMAP
jgi:hypothetical protein